MRQLQEKTTIQYTNGRALFERPPYFITFSRRRNQAKRNIATAPILSYSWLLFLEEAFCLCLSCAKNRTKHDLGESPHFPSFANICKMHTGAFLLSCCHRLRYWVAREVGLLVLLEDFSSVSFQLSSPNILPFVILSFFTILTVKKSFLRQSAGKIRSYLKSINREGILRCFKSSTSLAVYHRYKNMSSTGGTQIVDIVRSEEAPLSSIGLTFFLMVIGTFSGKSSADYHQTK